MQPHYIYSPREMTRWVRGIYEALKPLETLPIEGLVRVWAHEALRLFQDRLVHDEERLWTDENVTNVAMKHFPGVDTKVGGVKLSVLTHVHVHIHVHTHTHTTHTHTHTHTQAALGRPILYSNWLSKDYLPVDQEELRDYVKARLKVFYEEELDVPLVLFNEVLDHVLRIDRIFKQNQVCWSPLSLHLHAQCSYHLLTNFTYCNNVQCPLMFVYMYIVVYLYTCK